MIYYKISEEDLFDLTKIAYKYYALEHAGVDNWSGFDYAFEIEPIPSNEEIIEEINSCYEIWND